MNHRPHRDTILVEEASILSHDAHAGEQYVMRVHAPECAARALPGQFAHLSVAVRAGDIGSNHHAHSSAPFFHS